MKHLSKMPLKMVTKDYDHVAPLACGDVIVEGIDLTFERDTAKALDRTLGDISIDAGEISLSRHLIRLALGDYSFVGIPVFPYRSFRHRCFFVRRDIGLSSFEQLEKKRIGSNEWPATGNTWSRAVLRDHNVRIEGISWWVGSIDGTPSIRPQGELPPYVQVATDKTLLSMLLVGDLDALMCPNPPKGFYETGNPVVRLAPDYRSVEMEYYKRTGIFPPNHIIGVRREVYEKYPRVLRSLFLAFDKSKRRWQASRKNLADTTPWMLSEIEGTTALFGEDWSPYGIEPNRKAVQALCDELFAQGLNPQRLDGAIAFTEFEKVMRIHG